MRLIYAVPLVLMAVLGLVFYMALQNPDAETLPSMLIGKKAPDFALDPLPGRADPRGQITPGNQSDGLALVMAAGSGEPETGTDKGFRTTHLEGGSVSLVNFWASWCAPCKVEHPVLTALSREQGMTVHGINYKDDPEAALRFLRALGDPYARVGRDTSGRTAIDWGVYGVPETFLVGADGRILARHVGPLEEGTWDKVFAPVMARHRGKADTTGNAEGS